MEQQQTSRRKLAKLLALAACLMLSLSTSTSSAREKGEKETGELDAKTGMASWYHDKFEGRRTATGETFRQQLLTCASNLFPLGTWLRVTNLRTGLSVIVKVNDRMHPRMKRVVDLTRKAAREIGIEKAGVGKVQVENLGKTKPEDEKEY